MIRITYFRDKCIGCNACVEAAPDRWRVSRKDGRCTLVEGVEHRRIFRATIPSDEYDRNAKAAKNCPVKIIRLEQL
ncbi:MAG: ferredoxin [Bacteroidetes Order II. Incertae sedis bacterium]|jgi:ferredoxin|nr:ferredoxin [Bacteroidetes Order II. bacterium]MBT4602368.1 ferredoxin [Bacteroidetes Order II. bacterium]MBT5250178.1 ferredoxin [Bacteroidetes Order II. bacterium]MBT6201799.1 ferredoxin [Bacteroidetes Order II. bacterium]MBT6425515.1 ferredoxin [Bacteroidetes Order II. bacterium]